MNSYLQSLYAGIIKIAANAAMVAAVFVGMYQSSHSAMSSELVFGAWFFGITVPVWAAAFWGTRLVRRRFPAEYQSFVLLPRQGRRLVSWHVAETSPCPVAARR